MAADVVVVADGGRSHALDVCVNVCLGAPLLSLAAAALVSPLATPDWCSEGAAAAAAAAKAGGFFSQLTCDAAAAITDAAFALAGRMGLAFASAIW